MPSLNLYFLQLCLIQNLQDLHIKNKINNNFYKGHHKKKTSQLEIVAIQFSKAHEENNCCQFFLVALLSKMFNHKKIKL